MQAVRGVRQVRPGRWEATISHRLVPGGRVFRTFDDEDQAKAFKLLMSRQLAKGVVPTDLLASSRRTIPMPPQVPRPSPAQAPPAIVRTTAPATELDSVVAAYRRADNVAIAYSDLGTLSLLERTLTGKIEGVTSTWVDAWVRSMKRRDRLAPGTIRKRVEALARCIDWWNRHHHHADSMPANPLRMLPRGYSGYRAGEVDGVLPRDVERDRRLEPGEAERIEAALMGVKRPDRERAWAAGGDADMLMLYRLIVCTGLRLREAYMLRVEHVRFDRRTIHVRMSKTGAKRDVPMTRQLEAWLRSFVGQKGPGSCVFKCWAGSDDKDVLRMLSARLSARFACLFVYAECPDLVQHDLRHEATCQWMEMKDREGRWLFRPEEVRKITGHKSEVMFMRYLSLRGSDLADRLD